jgi:hypothetical protein
MIQRKQGVWLCLLLLFPIAFTACKKRGELQPIRYIGSYNRDFNDMNDVQMEMANAIGIKPVADRDEAVHLKKKLKEVRTGKHIAIDKLSHSIPFLIPEAAELLKDIGRNFADSLEQLNAPHYKIIVTSVTRTKDDIRRLRKRNVNSTENSTHMYGTTFDISWRRFEKTNEKDPVSLSEDQLKRVLACVLRDLKRNERCYVKHERQQACFHITVRN